MGIVTTSVPSKLANVTDRYKLRRVLAKPGTFVFTAYRKNTVHVHHCNDGDRPCFDQSETTGIRKSLLKLKTLHTGD